MQRTRRIARVTLVLLAGAPGALACPTCRDALARADARWASGFSLGVVFLLGTLLLVASAFSFAVWRSVRNR